VRAWPSVILLADLTRGSWYCLRPKRVPSAAAPHRQRAKQRWPGRARPLSSASHQALLLLDIGRIWPSITVCSGSHAASLSVGSGSPSAPACVEALLEAGTSIGAAYNFGSPPSVLAAQGGHVGCVKALLAAGADTEAAADTRGTMALRTAAGGREGLPGGTASRGRTHERSQDNSRDCPRCTVQW
jgi:hypothetical protein